MKHGTEATGKRAQLIAEENSSNKSFSNQNGFSQEWALRPSLECAFLVALFRTLPIPLHICFIWVSSGAAVRLWPENSIKATRGIRSSDRSSPRLGSHAWLSLEFRGAVGARTSAFIIASLSLGD